MQPRAKHLEALASPRLAETRSLKRRSKSKERSEKLLLVPIPKPREARPRPLKKLRKKIRRQQQARLPRKPNSKLKRKRLKKSD